MHETLLAGRYRLGPEIGSGGMGAVHRARDELLGRDVAVKLLRTDADATDCARLRREVEYLERVHHPNLVAVLDAGADRIAGTGTAWFAMELVQGPDLRRLLRDRGPMDGVAARHLLQGVLAALGALHEAGLVHRDVTPANILLTADPFARWDAKLTDLGIAQRLRAAPLTGVGRVVGTAGYLSPEQITGAPVGPPTDVYALALVVLEALTGRPPFPGGAVESATARLLRPPTLPTGLAPAWHALLTAATAPDPAGRPSVAAMLEAAGTLPDDAGDVADPQPAEERTTAVATARATAVQRTQATGRLTTVEPPHRLRRGLVLACVTVALVASGVTAVAAVQHGVAVLAAQRIDGPAPTASSAPRATSTPAPTATAPVVDETPETLAEAPGAQAGPPAPPDGGPGGRADPVGPGAVPAGPGAGPAGPGAGTP